MEFQDYVVLAGQVVEGAGIAAILLGALWSVVATVREARMDPAVDSYRLFRRRLGRAILLGLELLVAADIIRTVSHDPTLEGVGALAGIVLIRTFLSFTLELEVEGRWPWERARPAE